MQIIYMTTKISRIPTVSITHKYISEEQLLAFKALFNSKHHLVGNKMMVVVVVCLEKRGKGEIYLKSKPDDGNRGGFWHSGLLRARLRVPHGRIKHRARWHRPICASRG